ncbi:glutamate--cysteine ligase regulatory subunit [Penaeus vannamei]|uniref:glutamate--cysteine ligase regulatory subunit n=1 Tax=Penaeus vannamei TaxID=6689 RepID=UPI00387F8FA9
MQKPSSEFQMSLITLQEVCALVIKGVYIAIQINKKNCFSFQVNPTTVQVNLSSCCVVPQELTTFAQKQYIQVLTHNDPAGKYYLCSYHFLPLAEIVDKEVVSTITSRLGLSGVQCQVEWVARHRTIQQCFGLIQDKGYTLALACDG